MAERAENAGKRVNHVKSPPEPSEFLGAIEKKELSVVYQPQKTCDLSRIVGFESLVRRSAVGGAVAPSAFVHRAEKNGDIDRLGEWVLRRACVAAAAWGDVIVAVNVSPLQFRSPGFVDLVADAAASAGLPLTRLELEITEGAYFDDIDSAEAEIRSLRELGVRIALDDFGAGYASLTYLRRLPLDKIKIDKSFVDEIHKRDSAAIVKAVIDLAHSLGLSATAEGVETAEQLEFLREAACDFVQGYLVSAPLAATEVVSFIQKSAPARSQ